MLGLCMTLLRRTIRTELGGHDEHTSQRVEVDGGLAESETPTEDAAFGGLIGILDVAVA